MHLYLHVKWDPAQLHITGYELAEEVGRNKPQSCHWKSRPWRIDLSQHHTQSDAGRRGRSGG